MRVQWPPRGGTRLAHSGDIRVNLIAMVGERYGSVAVSPCHLTHSLDIEASHG